MHNSSHSEVIIRGSRSFSRQEEVGRVVWWVSDSIQIPFQDVMSMRKRMEDAHCLLSPGFRQETELWVKAERQWDWCVEWISCNLVPSWQLKPALWNHLIFSWCLGLRLPRNRLWDRIWVQSNVLGHTGRRWDKKGNGPMRSEFSGQVSLSHPSCGARKLWYLTSSLLSLPNCGLLPRRWVLQHFWFALLKAWMSAPSDKSPQPEQQVLATHSLPA